MLVVAKEDFVSNGGGTVNEGTHGIVEKTDPNDSGVVRVAWECPFGRTLTLPTRTGRILPAD